MRSRAVVVFLGVLALLLATPGASGADSPAKAELPGGMSRFVASVGGLSTDSRENWVRLATYSFTADGKVTESHFHWTQRERVKRSLNGVHGNGCDARDCEVRTANGYQATSFPEKLSGSYTVDGDQLTVEWPDTGTETWKLSSVADGKLAKLTFVDSSYGATHGYGYGSEAKWDERASMAEVAAFDHEKLTHNFVFWKTDEGAPYLDKGSGSPFWRTEWKECESSRCLGGKNPDTEYYLATANSSSTDRRDTLWHWRTELADGRGEYCYTGNSHVKPMLQIIDSDGGFHGWVAAEASISETSSSTDDDDIGVFEISEY
ncbi:hypothetical protein [Tamaricihabitans halophyticus]|nr:hypothetical protein [Tamaricihabitans halophyticus]